MIQEFFSSFKENIKDKTTNPFFGTLIIVWIIHNYSNLYQLLFSSSYLKFEKKLEVLDKLLSPKEFLLNLLTCIFISFGTLLITYSLLNISRLIVNFFEKTVTPLVYKITDKSFIVLKQDYEKLYIDKENLQIKFEKERERRIQLEAEIEKLELKKTFQQNPLETINTNNRLDGELESIKIFDLLKNKGYLEFFENLIYSVNVGNYISEKEEHRFLIKLGLINATPYSTGTSMRYTFTEKGLAFLKYFQTASLSSTLNSEGNK